MFICEDLSFQCDGDDASAEPRQHSVENCPFPGFRKGELTELPSQLEAPLLLNRVTKAQDFSVSGFYIWIFFIFRILFILITWPY